eukprot:CAMPEP_0118642598 /NCGR_PEP_ID=MMETSP0785-20121206/5917_1 /TAXON_ID=91992 /ORGANISM="Bolidomonas pacifica, Strain CCMP 1866" /LENGTH=136 /DNA_ID=CAMNT_0006534153 /DNA_START=122 /DNA_END=529 /DNA_ORIENTATION=+
MSGLVSDASAPLCKTLREVIATLPEPILHHLLTVVSSPPYDLVLPLNAGSTWDIYDDRMLRENLIKEVNGYFEGSKKNSEKVARFCGALVDIEEKIKFDHEKQDPSPQTAGTDTPADLDISEEGGEDSDDDEDDDD